MSGQTQEAEVGRARARVARPRMAAIRHLATPAGTPGVEVSITEGVETARSIGAALETIHGRLDPLGLERAALLAIALAEGDRTTPLTVRAWSGRSSIRVELANPPATLEPDGLGLLERLSDRWGIVDAGERTVWFEVLTSEALATT